MTVTDYLLLIVTVLFVIAFFERIATVIALIFVGAFALVCVIVQSIFSRPGARR